MTDEKYTFETARLRLEEIVAEVRKKDTSLEKSLDLLEEGVRLANICTELVDHADVSTVSVPGSSVSSAVRGAEIVDAAEAMKAAGGANDGNTSAGQGIAPDEVATDSVPDTEAETEFSRPGN